MCLGFSIDFCAQCRSGTGFLTLFWQSSSWNWKKYFPRWWWVTLSWQAIGAHLRHGLPHCRFCVLRFTVIIQDSIQFLLQVPWNWSIPHKFGVYFTWSLERLSNLAQPLPFSAYQKLFPHHMCHYPSRFEVTTPVPSIWTILVGAVLTNCAR